MTEIKRKTGIILALDVTDRESALRIAENVSGSVDAVKIGYPLVLATGLSITSELSSFGPVIADFKVADIPNTDRLICEQVFSAGADAVIVQGFTGPDSLKECIAAAEKSGKKVFVVAEMSHPGGNRFMDGKVSAEIAAMARENNAFGIVAPATRPERVKELRAVIGNDLKIISPGVGAQGGSAADAIRAGADWIIVGRAVYQAEDPRAAVEKIAAEIRGLIRPGRFRRQCF